ncbi:MAG: putative 4-hydroxy-4-methyl-2-oxoglutarate aldolase, partial [Ferrovum sp.]|nr:putative 4-hydroxy-4-methyl-2-oxoglutarate aldolase [Ferrovum sp.]
MALNTADLCDQLGNTAYVADPMFGNYGGMTAFGGQIATLKVFKNNTLVRAALETPG